MLLKKPPEFWTNKPLGNPGRFKHILLCRIEKRPPKLDMSSYPYLPRADVETTSAASYMALLVEAAE